MDLPKEIDDYIKQSIEYTLGLPVSRSTLEVKLQASEESQRRLRDQYLLLHSLVKEKDEAIDRAKVCLLHTYLDLSVIFLFFPMISVLVL